MSKSEGFIHFDWLIPGHVSIVLSHGVGVGSTMQHLTLREAEAVGRRLIAWADWQRRREAGEVARQPGNRCIPKAAATTHGARTA